MAPWTKLYFMNESVFCRSCSALLKHESFVWVCWMLLAVPFVMFEWVLYLPAPIIKLWLAGVVLGLLHFVFVAPLVRVSGEWVGVPAPAAPASVSVGTRVVIDLPFPARSHVQVVSNTAQTRCPYCRDDLVAQAVACSHCRAGHHAECWDELGKCATCARTGRVAA